MDHARFITTTSTHQTPIYNSYPQPPPPTQYSYLIPHHPIIQNPNSIPTHELYGSAINPHFKSTQPPPGVESYAYINHAHHHQAQSEGYSYYPAADSVSIAPPDNNARNWATVIGAVRQYGVDPAAYGIGIGSGVTIPSNGTQHTVAHIPNSSLLTKPAAQPRQNSIWKRAPKKTTIAQSLHCGICKVDCSSRVVYEHHILGKKHKKVMEKLNESINHAPSTSTAVSNNSPVIGAPEKPVSTRQKSSKRNATSTLQEFETKKRKVLEGGAAAHAVRTCTVCNVVCNSDVVFAQHLSGQKHAAMVTKYATSAAATGNLTSLASRFIL